MNPAHTRTNPDNGPRARNAQIAPSTAMLKDNDSNCDITDSPLIYLLKRAWFFPRKLDLLQGVPAIPLPGNSFGAAGDPRNLAGTPTRRHRADAGRRRRVGRRLQVWRIRISPLPPAAASPA